MKWNASQHLVTMGKRWSPWATNSVQAGEDASTSRNSG